MKRTWVLAAALFVLVSGLTIGCQGQQPPAPPPPAAQPPQPPPASPPPRTDDCPAELILAILRQQQQQSKPGLLPSWPPPALKQGLTCTMELSQLSIALPGSNRVCTVMSITNNLLSILYSWQLLWQPASKALRATNATGAQLLNSTGDSNTVQLINQPQCPSIAAQGGSADMLVQLGFALPQSSPAPQPPSSPAPAPSPSPSKGGSTTTAIIKPAAESVYLNGLQCTLLPLAKAAGLGDGDSSSGAFLPDDCSTAEWPVGVDGLLLSALDQLDGDDASGSLSSWRDLNINSTSSSVSNMSALASSVNVTAVLAALRQLSCVSQLCCGLQVVPSSVVSIGNSSSDASNSTEPRVVASDGPPEPAKATDGNSTQQAEDLAVLPTDITPEPSTQQSGGNTALIVGLVVAGVVAVCVGALLVVLLRHKRHKRQLLAAHLKQQADAQHGLVRHGSGASSNGSGGAVSLASVASAEWRQQQQQQQYTMLASRPPVPGPKGATHYTLPTHNTAPPHLLNAAAAAAAAAEMSAVAAGVWRAGSWQGPDAYTQSAGAATLQRSASGPQPLIRTTTASTNTSQASQHQTPTTAAATAAAAAFGSSQPTALALPPPTGSVGSRNSLHLTVPGRTLSGSQPAAAGVGPSGSSALHQHHHASAAGASAHSTLSPRDMLVSTHTANSSLGSTWGSLRRFLGNHPRPPAPPGSSTLASRANTSSSTLGLERQGSQPPGYDTGHGDTTRSLALGVATASATAASTIQGQHWEHAGTSQHGLYRPPLQLIQEAAPLSATAAAYPPHTLSQQQLQMLTSAGLVVSSSAAAAGAAGGVGTVSRRISPVLSVSEDASSAASNDSATPASWHLTDRQLLEDTPGWLNIDFAREVRLEKKLGEGGFGQVFRARWRGEVIAAKLVPFMSLIAQHNMPSISLVSAAAGTHDAASATAAASGSAALQPSGGTGGDAGHLSNMRLGVQFSSASLRAIKVEIRVLSQLSHPNIVAFKGACLAPPHICILEELAEGGSLHSRLYSRSSASKAAQQQRQRQLQQQQASSGPGSSSSNSSSSPAGSLALQPRPRKPGTAGASSSRGGALPPPLSVSEVLHIAHDVSEAMLYLHTLQPQVVHRDLKPQNVLLDLQGRAKIADFGISKMKDASLAASSTRLQAGTPAYMAVEQFEGCSVTDKVDVFAFGVLLWECFEQQQPWKELSPMQIIYSVGVQKERLPRPARCPDQLWQLIEACWAQDPQARPSFADILVTLQQLQQQEQSTVQQAEQEQVQPAVVQEDKQGNQQQQQSATLVGEECVTEVASGTPGDAAAVGKANNQRSLEGCEATGGVENGVKGGEDVDARVAVVL